MRSFGILLKNEMKLSLRDMNMPIFAVGMPLAMLAVYGLLFGHSPAFEGAPYTALEQGFGALCAISMCAGGLMGLPMVVSDYRERRILKRFRVTPVRPALLLGVELTMYALYCVLSLLTLGAAAALCGVRLHGAAAAFLGSWLLTMLSTLSIGLMVGGLARNARQAGVIATVLYFPALLFSGTTLPIERMPALMQRLVSLFPLTQGIELMKRTFLGLESAAALPVAVMAGVKLVCTAVAVRFFRWE